MSRPRKRRLPAFSIVLLAITLVWMIRSFFRRDTIPWQSIGLEQGLVVSASTGFQIEQLGFSVFRDVQLTRLLRAPEVTPGLVWISDAACTEGMSLARRLGFEIEQEIGGDDRSEIRTDLVRVTIPLWGLAIAWAVAPAAYLIASRRQRSAAVVAAETSGGPS